MGRKQTEETKIKIREKFKERLDSGWTSSWRGKHHSEATKLKMSKNHADVTGEKNPMFGKKPGRKNQWGENNPYWKGGVSYKRKYIFRKHKAICERCGIEDKRILLVHHKDRDRKNNKEENIEILCRNCHTIEHYKTKHLNTLDT